MVTDKEKNYVHTELTETGLNVSNDLVNLLQDNDIPLHWIFGSPGIYSRRITLTRLFAQYEIFKMVQHLPGSIVECGVFQGNGLLTYAKLLEIFCPGDRWRKVFGFDTFDGFQEFVPQDGQKSDAGSGAVYDQKAEGGYSSNSFYNILEQLVDITHKDSFVPHSKRIELIKGDVTQTLPKFVEEKAGHRISLLILDMDLYEPTMAALTHLYDMVVPGGVVVLDEYSHEKWPGESKAFDDFFVDKKPKLEKFNWSGSPGAFFRKEG